MNITKNIQYYKFSFYGFLKNLRFFDAFFILYLVQKGIPYTQIGILYAIREIVINVIEIPSGIIADTYGRKNALLGSFLSYIFSFIIFYISNDFWFFLGAFILYGIGDAFRSGTHKGMIIDYLMLNDWGSQKINYYGHTRSWSQKGSAISSLIAGLIVFYSGSYQNIFLYSIVPYLLNFLLILSYPKELNHSIKSKQKSIKLTISSITKIIKQPKVLQIMNSSAFHSAYLKAFKDYIQLIMVSFALILPIMVDTSIEKKNGIVIGIIYFFIYILTSITSKYASKIEANSKKNITFITLLMGLGFGILSGIFYINDLWALSLIAFVGIYIIENIRKPIMTGYIADNVPNEILASVISVQSLLRTIITVFIALGFGIMADIYGIGIAIIVVSLVLVFVSFLFLVKKQRVSL